MTKSKKSIVMHGMLLCPLVLGHCAFLRANGKKSIVMHGMLLCPLVLGHCAFLRANGSDYRTSPVVAIHEQSGDLVHFETLNSNYFLSMAPFPLAAASPLPTVLAACA